MCIQFFGNERFLYIVIDDDEANFDRLRACRSEQEVLDLIKNATAAAV